MYFRVNEGVGGWGDYGEDSGYRGPSLGMAVALPVVGIGAIIVAVLEAVAFVATAIAAAYLLIKAYEKAKSLGIGVEWAGQQLIAAMTRVVSAANRIIGELRRLIDQLTGRQLPPDCERLLALMRERLARIEEAVRRYIAEPTNIRDPQSPAKVQLLRELDDSMERIGLFIQVLRQCLRM